MAERRMFTKKITDSDAFLDMPLSSQALYFHINMAADDEGFVNNPKKIQRVIGASDDDLKILVAKNFLIRYESGVIVIKHWRMHNYIQKDRFHPTVYEEERQTLQIKENGAYTLSVNEVCTECIQDVSNMDTEVSIGKYRIDKDNKYSSSFDEFWKCYPRKQDKGQAYKCYQARLNDGYTEEQLLTACKNYALECEIEKREKRYIKVASTFLSVNEPFVEYFEPPKVEPPKPKSSLSDSVSRKIHNYDERDYDFDELQKIATGGKP